MQVNLNDTVHFFLSESGVRHVLNEWEADGETLSCFRAEGGDYWSAPRPKVDVLYRTTLWEFMQMFGSNMGMLREPNTKGNRIFIETSP